MKVADVELFWKKSPSSGITKTKLQLTINGATTTTADLGAEIEQFNLTVSANSNVAFSVTTYNIDGLQVTSENYTFSVDSLEAPLPATELGHRVVGIRDVPDEPTS